MEEVLKLYSGDSSFNSLLEYRISQNICVIVQFHKTDVRAVHLNTARLRPSKCMLLIFMFLLLCPSYSSLMKEAVGTVIENTFSTMTKDREVTVLFTFLKTVFCC